MPHLTSSASILPTQNSSSPFPLNSFGSLNLYHECLVHATCLQHAVSIWVQKLCWLNKWSEFIMKTFLMRCILVSQVQSFEEETGNPPDMTSGTVGKNSSRCAISSVVFQKENTNTWPSLNMSNLNNLQELTYLLLSSTTTISTYYY